MMFRTRMVAAALSLAFTGLIPAAQATPASNEPRQAPAATAPESNWSRDFKEFTGRLETLAKENGIVFLVEGMPLRKLPPPADAARTDVNPSLAEKITAQVRAFDYEPVVLGKVVVLRKKYTDPQDTPSVTLEEYTAVLGDMARLLRSVIPKVKRTSEYSQSAIDSLTPEQRKAWESGKLAVRDLGAEQRRAVDAWVCWNYFGLILRGAEGDLSLLQPPAEPTFVAPGLPLPGTPIRDNQGHTFLLVDRPSGPPYRLGLGERADASVPEEVPFDGPIPDPAFTLGAVVARVNQSAKGRAGAPPLLLDEMFIAKSAMLVGDLEFAQPDTLAQGLALMYGLARQVGPNREIVLTRRTVRAIPEDLTPEKFPDVLTRLLPEPIRRAIHFDAYARRKRELDAQSQRAFRVGENAIAESDRVDREKMGLDSVVLVARSWAVLRLRERVRAREKDAAREVRVPVSKLDAPSRNLLAAARLFQLGWQFLHSGLADVPQGLRNYGDLVLSGGIHDDKDGRWAELDLNAVFPNGELHNLTGTAARYHQETKP